MTIGFPILGNFPFLLLGLFLALLPSGSLVSLIREPTSGTSPLLSISFPERIWRVSLRFLLVEASLKMSLFGILIQKDCSQSNRPIILLYPTPVNPSLGITVFLGVNCGVSPFSRRLSISFGEHVMMLFLLKLILEKRDRY